MASIKLKDIDGVEREFTRFICECQRLNGGRITYFVVGIYRDDFYRESDSVVYCSFDVECALDQLDIFYSMLEEAIKQEASESPREDNSLVELLEEVNFV